MRRAASGGGGAKRGRAADELPAGAGLLRARCPELGRSDDEGPKSAAPERAVRFGIRFASDATRAADEDDGEPLAAQIAEDGGAATSPTVADPRCSRNALIHAERGRTDSAATRQQNRAFTLWPCHLWPCHACPPAEFP
jgi:hypothetical protein